MKQLRSKPMIQDGKRRVEEKKDIQQRIQPPGLVRFRHNLGSRLRGRDALDLLFDCRTGSAPLWERVARPAADWRSSVRKADLSFSRGSSGGMTIRSRQG